MADINPQVQQFSPVNFGYSPLTHKTPIGGTSLSALEAVNTLRGLVNLEKEQALLEPSIAAGKATSEQAITGSQSAAIDLARKKQIAIGTGYISQMSDPLVLKAASNPASLTNDERIKLESNVRNWGLNQGKEVGMSPEDALKLTQPYIDIAKNNPDQLLPHFKSRLIAGLNTAEQASLNQLQTVGGQPSIVNAVQGTVSPVTFTGSEQPVAPQGQPAGALVGAPTSGVTSGQMNMPPMQYPVRKAGQPYAQLPTEPKDIEVGQTYKNNLVSNQVNLTTMRRNIDEVLKEADALGKNEWAEGAGVVGKVGRDLSIFLGTEQGVRYKQLSKDLANTAISAIKASGSSLETDAGKQLTRAANGDETFPPSVLNSIARRAKADITNTDMQATAAQRFANLYGDQNLNTFKKLWGDNADSKIFELKNIFDNNKISKEEKNKARNELLGNNPADLKEFSTKWKNIEKLEKTGHL